jgi:hypothetical protein
MTDFSVNAYTKGEHGHYNKIWLCAHMNVYKVLVCNTCNDITKMTLGRGFFFFFKL